MNLCGHAGDGGVIRNIFGHHGPGPHHGSFTDGDTGQDGGIASDRCPALYPGRKTFPVGIRLEDSVCVGRTGKPVVGEHHPVTDKHFILQISGEVDQPTVLVRQVSAGGPGWVAASPAESDTRASHVSTFELAALPKYDATWVVGTILSPVSRDEPDESDESDQGLMLVILDPLAWTATATLFGLFFSQVLVAGVLANLIMPGEISDFIQELPPLRVPRFRVILSRSARKACLFLKEALPAFVAASFLLFVLDRVGGLTALEHLTRPLVNGFLGLPDQISRTGCEL